jgi:hypothetical protein
MIITMIIIVGRYLDQILSASNNAVYNETKFVI